MRKVLEFIIADSGISRIEMSLGAKILSVNYQGTQLSVFALCEREVMYTRTLYVVNTNEDMYEKYYDMDHVATVRNSQGVDKHIFEVMG